jgi:glutathione S-transferase
MKLYATPISHFARKDRILLDLYQAPYEFIDIGNVTQTDPAVFGGNPLMRVPVLVDGKTRIFDSDNIAKYIVEKLDPADKFRVNTASFEELNIRALINSIMAEEVKLVLARRTGLPTEEYPFFDKCQLMMKNGLEWLEENSNSFHTGEPGYLEFHLTCLIQHLDYYELLPLNYPKLKKMVDTVLTNPLVSRTSPFILKPKNPHS